MIVKGIGTSILYTTVALYNRTLHGNSLASMSGELLLKSGIMPSTNLVCVEDKLSVENMKVIFFFSPVSRLVWISFLCNQSTELISLHMWDNTIHIWK